MTIPAADVTVAISPLVASVPILAWSITPADAGAYATAIGIIIGAVFVGWANLIGAKAAARRAVKEELQPVAKKIDDLVPVVEKINTHVNSEKDRALGELAARDLQITLQREMIEEMKKAAGLLAQAKAVADTSNAIAQAAVAGATTPPVVVVTPPDVAAKKEP